MDNETHGSRLRQGQQEGVLNCASTSPSLPMYSPLAYRNTDRSAVLLRACLVKVRVNLFVGLGYAEDLILMAFFGRNASKIEEATPKTAHIRLFPVAKKQI